MPDRYLRGVGKVDRRDEGLTPSVGRLDRTSQHRQSRPEGFENIRRHSVSLARKSEEEMLRSDVRMVEALGLVLRERENAPRTVVEVSEWCVSRRLAHRPVRPRRDGPVATVTDSASRDLSLP